MLSGYIGSFFVRFFGCFLISFATALIIGPRVIESLKNRQIGQTIRDEGVQVHKKKAGTPTMGGIIILIPALLNCLIWAKFSIPLITVVLATYGMAFLGMMDDLTKVLKARSMGLTPRQKLVGQIFIALLTGIAARYFFSPDGRIFESFSGNTIPLPSAATNIPYYGVVELGILYIPFIIFVMVGASNAVNLTDGLDGLAGGTGFIAIFAFSIVAFFSGNSDLATFFQIPYLPDCKELAVFCAALMGGCLGFLWFNSNPAQVFMGDTGSLALGGALGALAVSLKSETLLAIVGGIFVVEALSVIIQVSYFKYTHGKRVFRMSPIHHHFELGGWAEQKVVARFCMTGFLMAVLGLFFLFFRGLVLKF
ncbi:MAG: phospho-N-acetylmuramoyl-pentapeptide-transferase [Candidatus Riflebacteria bacterium]|nr:phospho-N-acetylmuramoyl-pentapeptide-transferase [Candidatus Riflebacteria bacterium]